MTSGRALRQAREMVAATMAQGCRALAQRGAMQEAFALTEQLTADDITTLTARARVASDLMKALSHETRLMIVCILAKGERSVSELESLLAMPQAAVSQQLARLRFDRLVTARRDGRLIYYRLADGEVAELVAAVHHIFCKNI